MNILVSIPEGTVRDTFIPPDVASRINSMGNVRWNDTKENWTSEELKKILRGIDACICGWGSAVFDREVLQHSDRLKLIAYTGGTIAGIVSDEVFKKGIRVSAANWFFAQSLAEGTLAYMLSALRDIPYYDHELHEGRWRKDDFYNEGLLDQTVGLIGFGMTAQILVSLLKPFNVKIKVFSEHETGEIHRELGVQRASLEEVLTTCKIISVHMAQREDTYHILSSEMLKLIPEGRILVNTSRGSLIDEQALIEELSTGRFKAVLDVYEKEPLPVESRMRKLRNVILIPHMGGPTIDRRKSCTMGVLDDIERYFNGEHLKFEITSEYLGRMTRKQNK